MVVQAAVLGDQADHLLEASISAEKSHLLHRIAHPGKWYGRLRVEVEVRLSGNDFDLFSENLPFQSAYLNGRRGPMLEAQQGCEILGTEFRAVMDGWLARQRPPIYVSQSWKLPTFARSLVIVLSQRWRPGENPVNIFSAASLVFQQNP